MTIEVRPARIFFYLNDSAHPDRTAARGVSVVDPLRSNDQTVGREVRPLDPLADRGQRGFLVGLVVLQAPVDGLGELPQVVRRDVGGHADRDAAGSVGQQVREPARQDRRLLHAPVVVRDEIDCLLVDFTQHLHRERCQPRFCVVADKTVGDKCVVIGVDAEAVHRLNSRPRRQTPLARSRTGRRSTRLRWRGRPDRQCARGSRHRGNASVECGRCCGG